METMTLTIQVSQSVYEALKEKAKICGVSVEKYVEDLLEKHARELVTDESQKEI
jgi:predicted HicB family RNase H-like nuclease